MDTSTEKVSAGVLLQKYFQENIGASGKIYYPCVGARMRRKKRARASCAI